MLNVHLHSRSYSQWFHLFSILQAIEPRSGLQPRLVGRRTQGTYRQADTITLTFTPMDNLVSNEPSMHAFEPSDIVVYSIAVIPKSTALVCVFHPCYRVRPVSTLVIL